MTRRKAGESGNCLQRTQALGGERSTQRVRGVCCCLFCSGELDLTPARTRKQGLAPISNKHIQRRTAEHCLTCATCGDLVVVVAVTIMRRRSGVLQAFRCSFCCCCCHCMKLLSQPARSRDSYAGQWRIQDFLLRGGVFSNSCHEPRISGT